MGQPFIQFGSAQLYLNPNAGNLAVNPTPVRPFTTQDVKVGMKGKIESLRGQFQYPDDTATGDKDATFEFGIGRQDFNFLNQIFNADIVSTGGTSAASSPATAIPATPFHITPTIPSSGTWSGDLGVYNVANNNQFAKVASGPIAGQYSVSAGVYTFASADNVSGISVVIAFEYTTTTGNTYQVNNQTQGWGPQIEVVFAESYQPQAGVYSVVRLYAAKISDVDFDYKRSGYGMVSCKGSYFANSAGKVADFYSNVG